MKSILAFSRVLMITAFVAIAAQAHAQSTSDITNSFARGDGATLKKYLNSNVELVIQREDNVYSKEQVSVIMNSFFKRNVPSQFTIVHQGMRDNSQFVIGNLQTNNGTYRIYLLIKHNLIYQLRIENPND